MIQTCNPSFRPKNVNTARVYLHHPYQRWKKTRQRCLDSTYTQNVIAKDDNMNQLTNVVQCQRSNSQTPFAIQCKGQIFNIQIGTNFICSCSSSIAANRKTCCHIVLVLHYIFSVEKSNSALAQIGTSREIFDKIRESLPHELPESVTQCKNGRTFSAKLKKYPKFET